MPRFVITHAVHDVNRWLAGRDERFAALAGATNTADLVALDGSKHTGITFDFEDTEALTAMLASLPPEVAAQAESHGVKLPMTVYIEA